MKLHRAPLAVALSLVASLLPFTASAEDIEVAGAWARATVASQRSAGAFMQITSSKGGRLVQVSSPAAGFSEIHSMKMENGVMQMTRIAGMDLPAGRPVLFAPGGYHIMLFDLKKPLVKGEKLPLSLTLQGKDGVTHRKQVMVDILDLGATGPNHPQQH